MESKTGKLPKGQSYSLKPSVLAAALASAEIDANVFLVRSPGSLFHAEYWPPSANASYDRFYIQAGTVPSQQAADARRDMESIVIPKLVRWMSAILSADVKSPTRREKRGLNLGIP